MMYVHLPFFPLSVNEAYFTKGNIRTLKSAGKKFQNEVKNYLGKHHPDFLAYLGKKDAEFEILFVLFFEPGSLYCKTWSKESKVARHKRIDASNRLKLLEDAIVEAAGYDDTQHFYAAIAKAEALEGYSPYVEVWAWREEEHGPIQQFLHRRFERASATDARSVQ